MTAKPCSPVRRAAYHTCRYDAKARVEANNFERYYSCRLICESCMAENCTKRSNPSMWYFDFRNDRPRHLTYITDRTYRSTTLELSPWTQVDGWTLGTCLHDWMHSVYLGTARDLLPSLLQDWLDLGLLGDNTISLHRRLRRFPFECNKISKPTSRSLICFHPVLIPFRSHVLPPSQWPPTSNLVQVDREANLPHRGEHWATF